MLNLRETAREFVKELKANGFNKVRVKANLQFGDENFASFIIDPIGLYERQNWHDEGPYETIETNFDKFHDDLDAEIKKRFGVGKDITFNKWENTHEFEIARKAKK